MTVRHVPSTVSVTFALSERWRFSERRWAAVRVTRTVAWALKDAVRRTPAADRVRRPAQAHLIFSATRPRGRPPASGSPATAPASAGSVWPSASGRRSAPRSRSAGGGRRRRGRLRLRRVRLVACEQRDRHLARAGAAVAEREVGADRQVGGAVAVDVAHVGHLAAEALARGHAVERRARVAERRQRAVAGRVVEVRGDDRRDAAGVVERQRRHVAHAIDDPRAPGAARAVATDEDVAEAVAIDVARRGHAVARRRAWLAEDAVAARAEGGAVEHRAVSTGRAVDHVRGIAVGRRGQSAPSARSSKPSPLTSPSGATPMPSRWPANAPPTESSELPATSRSIRPRLVPLTTYAAPKRSTARRRRPCRRRSRRRRRRRR